MAGAKAFQELSMTPLLISLFAFLGGGIWGSFLGVIAVRVPQGISVSTPSSRCDHCLSPLSFSELIPYVSWVRFKGRCRRCHQRILPEIPVAEFSTGVYFLFVAFMPATLPERFTLLLFYSFALPLTLIDIRHHRLPHVLTISATVTALLFSLITIGIKGLVFSISGALLGFLPIALISFFYRRGIGMGDAFWLGAIGAFTGPKPLSLVLLVASLTGILAMITSHLTTPRESRGSIFERPLPFGPFLSLGGILALTFPDITHLINGYIMEIPL